MKNMYLVTSRTNGITTTTRFDAASIFVALTLARSCGFGEILSIVKEGAVL